MIINQNNVAFPAHITPATENKRSDGTLEAGMQRRSAANSGSFVE